MKEWCVNCEHIVVANEHGHCPLCDSKALAPAEDLQPWWVRKLQREAGQGEPNFSEAELRRLYEL